jgi:uncharacterized sulfatase
VLSLAGIKPPAIMQGVPFLGAHAGPPREYIYGIRDRMDERYDMTRAVRDQRYKYIRNYLPHVPWSQPLNYMDEMPTMQELRRLAGAGKLDGPAALWMAPTKPFEELYDTTADPHEVRNLAGDPEQRAALERLRAAHRRWVSDTLDLGFLPEAEIHARAAGKAPYDLVRQQPAVYPQDRVVAAAEVVARRDPGAAGRLIELLQDPDSAVRWWATVGLGALKPEAAVEPLKKVLSDPSPVVRVAAAGALYRYGRSEPNLPGQVLADALKDRNDWVRLSAMLLLDELADRDNLGAMKAAAGDRNQYVDRVLERALRTWGK